MLIVDDNEDSARSMAMLQRRRGHETRTAFTGPDAIAAAAEFAPEVVLLDIGLPGMDGFEVARRLRAMPALAGAFLVAMSGYGSDEDRATALEAGFDEYLVKPVDLDLAKLLNAFGVSHQLSLSFPSPGDTAKKVHDSL
jgi:CheY-like chemotaxis protein